MPRTAIAAQTAKGPYEATVSADELDLTLTAADVANGNEVAWSGNELLLLVQNSDATNPYTFTVASVADQYGRTNDITTYSLAAGEIGHYRLRRHGWQQSDNTLHLDASNAAIKFAVVALP